MSQIWIYSHDLVRKDIIETDVKVKVYDCITPQKTTFEVKKNDKIHESDIILIKDEQDYLGVIDTVATGDTTEVSMYPFEHIFDSELDIDKLDGKMKVVQWLQTQIARNFIDTDDYLMRLPIVFESEIEDVEYKTIVDTSNLLEVVNDIYLNTGIYIEFSPVYIAGKLANIKATFKNVASEEIRRIRYDNPQIVDKVNYEFSNTSANKVTIWVGKTEESKGKPYKIYLREDNELTSNPNDKYRIKKVLNKNIDFTAKTNSADELAEAIIVQAQSTLKSEIFGYKIEFVMMVNPRRKWHYRQACVFVAEDRTYNALVTRIEYLSDKHLRITLGAYRTKLHEKIQKIMKQPKEIGSSLGGISVTNGLGQYLYWFEQDDEGNLYVCSDNYTEEELSGMFEVVDGGLYVNYADGQRESLFIENGELIGGY